MGPHVGQLYAVLLWQVCTQEYLQPYLLDGFKFDMRLYVVLASVNPMRGYLCRVGMVRKAMVAYQEPDETNVKQLQKHLTNTSLNCKGNAAVECTFKAASVTRLSLTLATGPPVSNLPLINIERGRRE